MSRASNRFFSSLHSSLYRFLVTKTLLLSHSRPRISFATIFLPRRGESRAHCSRRFRSRCVNSRWVYQNPFTVCWSKKKKKKKQKNPDSPLHTSCARTRVLARARCSDSSRSHGTLARLSGGQSSAPRLHHITLAFNIPRFDKLQRNVHTVVSASINHFYWPLAHVYKCFHT